MHTVSHFQKAVMKIGDYLIVLALSLVAVIILGLVSSAANRCSSRKLPKILSFCSP